MEWLAGSRIALTPRPAQRRVAVLEAAMLGHCPGRVRRERLLALPAALEEMRAVGYGETVDELLLITALEDVLQGHLVERLLRGKTPDKSSLTDSLRDKLRVLQGQKIWAWPINDGLLNKVVEQLLQAKSIDDVLQDKLAANLLRGRSVDKLAMLNLLEAPMRDARADSRLLDVWVDKLLHIKPVEKSVLMAEINALLDQLLWSRSKAFYHLPIPLHSSAEFHDLFPDALTAATEYASLLAGDTAWLGLAVDDFFANGGEKLWVVRIPEASAQAGFLPTPDTRLHEVDTLQGLAAVLAIPSLGLVGLPDLERLQIPPRMPDIPRVRLDNTRPQFLPCTQNTGDDHRERRYGDELNKMPLPRSFGELIGIPQSAADASQQPGLDAEPRGILRWLVGYRPDVQCLWTLPLAYSGELDSPVLDSQAVNALDDFKTNPDNGQALRHMQFLFPYLRGPRFALHTPVGLIAGQQVAVARQDGPWRSMAARPLNSDALPYPRLSIAQTLDLREKPGVSVINYRQSFSGRGQLLLDDERLVVPALPAADYPFDKQRYDGFRSAEVMRFLGFLRRQLQALGEQLIFNLDYRDPRPRLLLEQFFRRLYAQGALRGASAEQAFSISESTPQEGAMVYEIMVAPAFPIDRLFLTFTNLDGEWRSEVLDG